MAELSRDQIEEIKKASKKEQQDARARSAEFVEVARKEKAELPEKLRKMEKQKRVATIKNTLLMGASIIPFLLIGAFLAIMIIL